MTTRARRTTTLVGPNRMAIGAATGGLVVLASAGTALLIVTGTSSVTPLAAPPPPLPTSAPLADAPGVVVLPSQPNVGSTTTPVRRRPARLVTSPVRRTSPVALGSVLPAQVAALPGTTPVALAFTDVPALAAPAAPAQLPTALTKAEQRALRKAERAGRTAVLPTELADLVASLPVTRAALIRTGAPGTVTFTVPTAEPTRIAVEPKTSANKHAKPATGHAKLAKKRARKQAEQHATRHANKHAMKVKHHGKGKHEQAERD